VPTRGASYREKDCEECGFEGRVLSNDREFVIGAKGSVMLNSLATYVRR
jgi:hypothetical protein